MTNLIDRYIFDVVRRLPEKEREDVSQELHANIYDMLPEEAGEAETKAVLLELGPPAQLAEQYRQKPRYLISPALYDDYIRALKLVLPVVASILFGVGLVISIINTAQTGISDIAEWVGHMIGDAVSMGVSTAIQTLVWITVGFAIADRVGAKTGDENNPKWKPEDLPEITPASKGRIPLVDCIAELIMTIFGAVFTVYICIGNIPFAWANSKFSVSASVGSNPLTSDFLAIFLPVMVVLFMISIFVILAKIKVRRWSAFIGGLVVTESILSIAAILFLVTRPNIFSPWVVDLVIPVSFTENGLDFLRVIIAAVVIAVSLVEMAHAIYKTIHANIKLR